MSKPIPAEVFLFVVRYDRTTPGTSGDEHSMMDAMEQQLQKLLEKEGLKVEGVDLRLIETTPLTVSNKAHELIVRATMNELVGVRRNHRRRSS